jgi:putative flippase GtrA
MITFLKAQASAIGATLIDFAATFFSVEVLEMTKIDARVTGLMVGGIVNFLVNRKWVFEKQNKVWSRLLRYTAVWVGNFIVNYVGYRWLLHRFPHLPYWISMIAVATVVGVFYNYLLQKKFVFK